MSPPKHPADPEAIVAAIRERTDRDDRDRLGGGVPTCHLADALPWTQSTITKHCRRLVRAGRLARVHGIAPADESRNGDAPRQRVSYLPVDHPDAPDGTADCLGRVEP